MYVLAALLVLWGIVAALFGVFVWAFAKSAVHEIEAGLSFLIATVAIGSAGVIGAIVSGRTKEPDTVAKPTTVAQDW